MHNEYVHRSRISEVKFRQIVKLFSLDLTATQITGIVGLNPKTVDLLITKMRGRISFVSKSKGSPNDRRVRGR